MNRAKLYPAQLRWSNRMTGLEIAPLDVVAGGDTRRLQRRADGTYGLLIQDDLEQDGYGEGCGVVVIALPRRMNDAEILAVRDRIQAVLAFDAEVHGG